MTERNTRLSLINSLKQVVLAHEIKEHVKRVTTPYKYPREVEFVEGLPKTISGKIRRVELREKKLGK